ncbi:MAG: RNA polymerase sigma factor RpoD/SigA [Bacteroidales bacterium]|nr:RNA polymerase sigma factor RpoD/SigA [Bacteroidales bacterium]
MAKKSENMQTVPPARSSLELYLQEIGTEELLSPQQEKELSLRIREGDREALDQLTRANLRFVVSVARKYQNQGLSLQDLIDEGNIGLIRAARNYNPDKGSSFISYAVWWIRQAILQALAQTGRLVRIPVTQESYINRINKAVALFEQNNGRRPSADELAQLVDLDDEQIEDAMQISGRHLSVDAPFSGCDSKGFLDVLPDGSSQEAELAAERNNLSAGLTAAFAGLTERERNIIQWSFGIGCSHMTFAEIAEKLSISRQRVRQIREKAMRKMRHSSSGAFFTELNR